MTQTLAKPWILHQTCSGRLKSCITWCYMIHALGAGLSRNKGLYGRFGVTDVMKTNAKPWILHQTCADRLESCNTW